MVPFGKQQEICAIFRRQAQKICQETAGRLLIEDGVVVVITNEKSRLGFRNPERLQCPDIATLERYWGLILWNSLSGEFISIPQEVIGMATTCEDKSRAVPKVIRSGV